MKKTIVKQKNACLTSPGTSNKNLLFLLLLVMQGMFLNVFAQTKILQGHIVNEKGEAVQGATVKYKTNTGRATRMTFAIALTARLGTNKKTAFYCHPWNFVFSGISVSLHSSNF